MYVCITHTRAHNMCTACCRRLSCRLPMSSILHTTTRCRASSSCSSRYSVACVYAPAISLSHPATRAEPSVRACINMCVYVCVCMYVCMHACIRQVFVLGFLATRAEPALRVMGKTVETLSEGQFSANMLVYTVCVGVGCGMVLGSSKILFGVCKHVCIHSCMYLCMHVCRYVCTYVCTYVRMYVRMYVCTTLTRPKMK